MAPLIYYKILVFVIWYKSEVVDVFGLKNMYDDIIITLPRKVFDQIAEDQETLLALPPKIQTNIKLNKKYCNMCNVQANKACGVFGNLKMEITERNITIK